MGYSADEYKRRAPTSLGGRRAKKSKLKAIVRFATLLLAVLVVANVAMWFVYRNRVLPNVQLGSLSLGNTSYDQIEKRLGDSTLVPAHIALHTSQKEALLDVSSLDARVDVAASIAHLKQQRRVFPLLSLLVHTHVPVTIQMNRVAFDKAITTLQTQLSAAALPERVTFENGSFVIANARKGSKPSQNFESAVEAAVELGRTKLIIAVDDIEPPQGTLDLSAEKQRLEKQTSTSVTYVVKNRAEEVSLREKGQWYTQAGQTMKVSKNRIASYANQRAKKEGVERAVNAADIGLATSYALQYGRATQAVIIGENVRPRLTYCTDVLGVHASKLDYFTQRAAAVLADPRGWNNGGKVGFMHVDNGCDFTIWLTAPAQMTTFGGICDTYYSCRVGDNVLINYDRWVGATEPWKKAGQSMVDYEALVINHEVGHRLGFGHLPCPGSGQLAPVMMQQSIELQGCIFNPWPVESELDTLGRSLGIARAPAATSTALLTHDLCCCADCVQATASRS